MPHAGEILLGVGLLGAVAAVAAPYHRGVGRAGLAAAAATTIAATGLLARALVTSDLTLAYVADQSRRGTSAPYRLAGLWGGMAGSLLVWATMTAVAGLMAARAVRQSGDDSGPVIAVSGGLLAMFLAVVLTMANPFKRLPAPLIDGRGLTPILEHPAMLYHPPLLYAGLISLVAPFALTIGALARREPLSMTPWLARCRRWMLLSWSLLTVGMVAGAHWAYAELGWGGFWAWDPVENTALLPWLAATAFLHAALRQQAGRGRQLAPGLVLMAFVLALLGTMLTRSGSVESVHAFAEDPAVGRALAAIVVLVAGGSALLAARWRRSNPPQPVTKLDRREKALVLHVVFVALVLAVVLAGTLAPLVSSLTGGREIAVEGRFFAVFAVLPALALLVMMPVGTRAHQRRLRLAVPIAAAAGAAVVAVEAGWPAPTPVLLAAAGAFAATAAVQDLWTQRRPGHLAHLGLALLLLGAAGSAAGQSATAGLDPGETFEVGGYEIRHHGVAVLGDVDDTVSRVVADVSVHRGGRSVARLAPELAGFRQRGVLLAETSLRSTPLDDVQVVLVDADDDGRALLTVHIRPLMMWVWWGGLMLAIAGLWAFSSRRPSIDVSDPTGDRASARVEEGPALAPSAAVAATPGGAAPAQIAPAGEPRRNPPPTAARPPVGVGPSRPRPAGRAG